MSLVTNLVYDFQQAVYRPNDIIDKDQFSKVCQAGKIVYWHQLI